MTETYPRRASRSLVVTQALLGVSAWLVMVLPYLRRAHGMERLKSRERYLFVANHVSLLDTILLGGLCWRSGCYPILVLGDRTVWHASRVKRLLSSPIGFLLDRGTMSHGLTRELQDFGRSAADFNLVVFPEGTRGDGVHVGPVKPGIFHVAQEARLPIVPVFIQNMQQVSTKAGAFHPVSGLRKVEVHFGEPIAADTYLAMPQEEFTGFIREKIATLPPMQRAEYSNPVPYRV